MKFDPGAIFEQIVGFYTRLPLAQKIALPVLIAGCMFIVVFISRWATEPEFRVLYSNLSDADASGVVERLKDKKIGYRLTDDGRTIEVTPPNLVHDVRLDLASSGLPKGDQVGFELWNDSKPGMSAVGEAVNLTRAVQGELERTIQKIEGVSAVRVHVTNPKRSVFVSRDVSPTASVLLRLKAGTELSQMQVKGIAHLVAGSIERLAPDNVTILDQNGKLLNEKPEGEATSGADLTHLDFQRQIENSYVKRIESMLAEVLGPGRAVARITAELDFSKFEKEEESYDPAGIVTRSEREIEENSGLTAEGGVPGVISNLTNDPGVLTPPDSAKGANVRRENVRNYEISRAVSKVVKSPGEIQKISVAVLVDGQYSEVPTSVTGEDGNPVLEKKYLPLSTEMMRKVENLVKQAVGFDATRGDIVTVENIRFIEPDQDLVEALEESHNAVLIWKALEWLPVTILTLVFFLVVVRPLVRFLVTPTESEVDLSRLLPAGIEELEAELEAERSKLSTLPDKLQPVVDIEELEQLLSENSRMVRDNPQQAALLIRYWLNDGRM